MQWYRLEEQEEPCLSQYSLSDNESDDFQSKKGNSVSCPPSSGTRKRVGFSSNGEITEKTGPRWTSSEGRSQQATFSYSSRAVMADAETQTKRQSLEDPTVRVNRSAVSLDALWRRFLELQISALEQTRAHGKIIAQREPKIETRKTKKSRSQMDAELERDKQPVSRLVAQYEVTPSAVAVEKGRKPNPLAFDISPGIPQQRSVSQQKPVPSLQVVTLQEALLHWKPTFAVHVKQRQKRVHEKRETRFHNKRLVAREEKPCVDRGQACSIPERLYRSEKRHIRRKEAVEQAKRSEVLFRTSY